MNPSYPPPKGLDNLTLSPPSHDLPPQYEPPRTHTARFSPLPPEEARARTTDSETESILPPYSVARYGIYGSEEEYLAALRAWVEQKSYVRLDEKTALTGFYGKETMQDYANRSGPRSSRKKMANNHKKSPEVGQSSALSSTRSNGQTINPAKAQRRKSSISQWLSHRRTAMKVPQDGGQDLPHMCRDV